MLMMLVFPHFVVVQFLWHQNGLAIVLLLRHFHCLPFHKIDQSAIVNRIETMSCECCTVVSCLFALGQLRV